MVILISEIIKLHKMCSFKKTFKTITCNTLIMHHYLVSTILFSTFMNFDGILNLEFIYYLYLY